MKTAPQRKVLTLATLATLTVAVAQEWRPLERSGDDLTPPRDYAQAIERTVAMAGDPATQRMTEQAGLNLLNLVWEDTGRFKNSAVGPNISDMTIQVEHGTGRSRRVVCMPIIRFPNFSDRTADLSSWDFSLMVGNHRKGGRLQRVSLAEFLQNPTDFMSNPRSWKGANRTLWNPRDEQVLVSAQACFLPIPQAGKATFNPVLFNYQSSKGNPAVLTILATREGTSMTVIDNTRDAFAEGTAWGQRLFFNQAGMRASLTGERLSSFEGGRFADNPGAAQRAGLNMVLLIQVPLKYRETTRGGFAGGFGGVGAPMMESTQRASNVEHAVIGHGEVEGPFTEVDNLAIERDPRFPVRVTVQFYKATSNGVVSPTDLAEIKRSINSVYDRAQSVGSLVTDGETGRPTEYWGSKVQTRDWWEQFWKRHEQNTGDSREVAVQKLRRLLGRDFMDRPVSPLYLRDLLRRP